MSIYFTLSLAFFIILSTQTGRVIITLYALKLGAQPFAVGVLAAMFSVLPTLLAWHVGRFCDRFGCRWLLLLGTAGRSGEAVGLRLTVNHLTRVVGQFFFGSIGSAFGVFPVFWINALLLASGWAVSHPRGVGRRHGES